MGPEQTAMNATHTPNRCRIVLIAPPGDPLGDFESRLKDALSSGDVASILLPAYDMDDASFQAFAERVVPIAQERGVAAVIAGDSRGAGRVRSSERRSTVRGAGSRSERARSEAARSSRRDSSNKFRGLSPAVGEPVG